MDIARSLDETLMTRQSWCTCQDPYWCDGSELLTEGSEDE